jgi:hypothetical protein
VGEERERGEGRGMIGSLGGIDKCCGAPVGFALQSRAGEDVITEKRRSSRSFSKRINRHEGTAQTPLGLVFQYERVHPIPPLDWLHLTSGNGIELGKYR